MNQKLDEALMYDILKELLNQYKRDVIRVYNILKDNIFPPSCFISDSDLISSKEHLEGMLYDGLDANFIEGVFEKYGVENKK